jgi:hypothetical protein
MAASLPKDAGAAWTQSRTRADKLSAQREDFLAHGLKRSPSCGIQQRVYGNSGITGLAVTHTSHMFDMLCAAAF